MAFSWKHLVALFTLLSVAVASTASNESKESSNQTSRSSNETIGINQTSGNSTGLLVKSMSRGSTLRVINGCNEPMWIAHCCNYKYRQNVKIEAGASHDFPAYAGLMGFRLWPKLRCNSDGNGCRIGQSGGKGQPCGTDGNWRCQAHIDTKFEASFGGRRDYFDMSLVDGYTLPFKLKLRGCSVKGGTFWDCSGLRSDVCPRGNREYYNGRLLGCHARGRPGRGSRSYIDLVHQRCPRTYAYDLDDKNGNFNCPHGTTYELTFLCP
ncbi:unnamed protein product [Durusdinium trenchii]|uniref:Thaumatin-like protein 1 n=2 Tax=Durusdinium trenchii TaxID=1381693 RepID=A0ABP0LY00_9DINO